MKIMIFLAIMSSGSVWAQCPGEDAEPAMTVKMANGTTLFVCGFEDRDVHSPKGKRAFSDFAVYYELGAREEVSDKAPQPPPKGTGIPAAAALDSLKAFASDPNETYWVKPLPGKGLELEELWFFADKPTPALRQQITCSEEACVASAQKCILKMKPNPFPKAISEFKKRSAAGTLNDDGEELIDQIFAQAFLGDKAAKDFYAAPPANLDSALVEAFTANKKKLAIDCRK